MPGGTTAALSGLRHLPARQASLRRHNLALLLGELAASGPLTRAELSRRVGLTKATVSSLVEVLIGAGALAETSPGAGPGTPSPAGRGRPGAPVGFAPAGPVAVGLEVGVDYLAACVVDLAGNLRRRDFASVDNRSGRPGPHLAQAAAMCLRLAGRAAAEGCRVVGTGLAVPGVVDQGGTLWAAPNLPRWVGTQPGAALAGAAGDGELGGVVEVGNEANLAALAELWYGGRPDLRDFVLVSGEIGVGAGIVVDGRLFSGAGGGAGELGHVVVDIDGPGCGCGSCGCLEQYAGQEALLRASGAPDRPGLVVALAGGDRAACVALSAAGRALGVATSSLLNVVDVPAVVLGGIYADLAPYMMSSFRAELSARVISRARAPVEVFVASLGADAAMRGAAGAVLQRVLADPSAYIPGVDEAAEALG